MTTTPADSRPPPVIGGLRAACWYVRFFRDPVGGISKVLRQFGPLLVLGEWALGAGAQRDRTVMLAIGARFNRQVLSDPDTFYSGGITICGPKGSALNRVRYGLIGMNGDKHRQQRRLVMPLFDRVAMDRCHQDMSRIITEHLDAWPVGRVVDVHQCVNRLALCISAHHLLGREADGGAVRLGEMVEELLRRSYSPSVWGLAVDFPGTPYRRLLRHAGRLEREVLDMIRRRVGGPRPARPDMLDLLIATHQRQPRRMTEDDLLSQVCILFGASYETTAVAIAWTLFLLAQHPHVTADLHDEISQAEGGRPPGWEQLERMPLLDAVAKESMRLFPPVPFVVRRVEQPTSLAGVTLKQYDRICLSHYHTHRCQEVFPSPNRFLPERWFGRQPSTYQYLPFSAGPRVCVGKGLGTLTLKLVVASILQRFRFRLVPRSRIDRTVRVTMTPKRGLPMVLAPQDRQFQAAQVRGNVHEMVDLRSNMSRESLLFTPPSENGASPGMRKAA